MRKCDCNLRSYPNISLMSDGISFNITPSMYLFTSASASGCYLGISPLSTPFIILGDMFLQHNTVIFDKTENKMGFIENYIELDPFVYDDNLLYVFDFLEIGLVLAGVGLCLLANKKR